MTDSGTLVLIFGTLGLAILVSLSFAAFTVALASKRSA